MLVHHIGYLVNDIEQACTDFEKLGYYPISQCIFDADRKVFIQFLKLSRGGGIKIELIAPGEHCNLFPKKMRQLGSMPYHICYECNDFEKNIAKLQEEGFLLIREPQAAPAIDNRRVAFLYSESMGQIELLEKC